jgi:hypothetical protein
MPQGIRSGADCVSAILRASQIGEVLHPEFGLAGFTVGSAGAAAAVNLLEHRPFAAFRAYLTQRPVPSGIIAIRVVVATEERFSATGLFLDQFAITALTWTFNTGCQRLDIGTGRVI